VVETSIVTRPPEMATQSIDMPWESFLKHGAILLEAKEESSHRQATDPVKAYPKIA
jgi:hypothetical protein